MTTSTSTTDEILDTLVYNAMSDQKYNQIHLFKHQLAPLEEAVAKYPGLYLSVDYDTLQGTSLVSVSLHADIVYALKHAGIV
jgi:hypothetical protein